MSLVTDLPAIFDQFSEARQKGFLTVMDLQGARHSAGWYLLYFYAARDPNGSRCGCGFTLFHL